MTKPRNFFARKKTIVSEKKKIKNLNLQKKEVNQKLKKIKEMYAFPEGKVNHIPMSASIIPEFNFDFEDGVMDLVKLKGILKDDYKDCNDELDKISSEIKISQVEMLLAKITIMENELDK